MGESWTDDELDGSRFTDVVSGYSSRKLADNGDFCLSYYGTHRFHNNKLSAEINL